MEMQHRYWCFKFTGNFGLSPNLGLINCSAKSKKVNRPRVTSENKTFD